MSKINSPFGLIGSFYTRTNSGDLHDRYPDYLDLALQHEERNVAEILWEFVRGPNAVMYTCDRTIKHGVTQYIK